jgi:hypothetical protein
MNPSYAAIVKQDLNKLLNASFIALMEEASWLLPIIVVLKKKRQASNLHGFPTTQCYYQKRSISFTLH